MLVDVILSAKHCDPLPSLELKSAAQIKASLETNDIEILSFERMVFVITRRVVYAMNIQPNLTATTILMYQIIIIIF